MQSFFTLLLPVILCGACLKDNPAPKETKLLSGRCRGDFLWVDPEKQTKKVRGCTEYTDFSEAKLADLQNACFTGAGTAPIGTWDFEKCPEEKLSASCKLNPSMPEDGKLQINLYDNEFNSLFKTRFCETGQFSETAIEYKFFSLEKKVEDILQYCIDISKVNPVSLNSLSKKYKTGDLIYTEGEHCPHTEGRPFCLIQKEDHIYQQFYYEIVTQANKDFCVQSKGVWNDSSQ